LKEILEGPPGGKPWLADLAANALRCAQRGRYDDAVARLYRAIEALGQSALREKHQIPDSGKVPLERCPDELKKKIPQDNPEPAIKWGLQDVFRFLLLKNDPLGLGFSQAGLDQKQSPLNGRNSSILAHGFQPVPKALFDGLWAKFLELAQLKENQLFKFPKLEDGPGRKAPQS
jgi:hypothetical protein